MALHQAHALLLAGCLLLPLSLLAWRFGRPSAVGTKSHILDLGPLSKGAHLSVLIVFAVVVLAVTIPLAAPVAALTHSPAQRDLVLVLFVVTAVGLLVTPFYPLAGALVYLSLSYQFPRDHAVTGLVMQTGILSWVSGLTFLGAILWRWRRDAVFRLPRADVLWCVAAFAASVGLAIVTSVVAGRPLYPDLVARATRYVHAVALCGAMAMCRPSIRDVRVLALTMGAMLMVRFGVLTPSWLFEQNLAMLTVISVPMVLTSATHRPFGVLQLPLAPIAGCLMVMVIMIQNRGAVLGMAAALAVLWVTSRHRWKWAVAAAVMGAPLAVWALGAGAFDRFWQIYSHGAFVGSAAERLEIWRGGLAIARDHWLLGVGPGNFAVFRTLYAHNSLVEVLVEMGVGGLALYFLMFAVALWRLNRMAWSTAEHWRRGAARGLMAAFAAHLVAGSFLSNTNLVWTYVLLGLAAAVTSRPAPSEAAEG